MFFAGCVFVDDFAVVEDGFDFLRAEFRAERESLERGAAGFSG